jgi:hypothetical protein
LALGFSVDELLPKARGGGQLKMGLVKLSEDEWLQPDPDLAARKQAYSDYMDGLGFAGGDPEVNSEVAETVGTGKDLRDAALASHEDMCMLERDENGVYRLTGAAVFWPSDWSPRAKLGLPMRALHEPIQGYEEQLAAPVDTFMDKLKAGSVYGRANWFITSTSDMHWRAQPPEHAFAHITPANAGETLFVRSERQTLRKLLDTGAILFTIGIYVEALGKLTPANQAMLSEAMETLLDGEGDRRGSPYYAPHLREYVKRNAQ